MARHYCKFKRWTSDEGVIGEIIGTTVVPPSSGTSHYAAFVIEYKDSYYTRKISECTPAKKPRNNK